MASEQPGHPDLRRRQPQHRLKHMQARFFDPRPSGSQKGDDLAATGCRIEGVGQPTQVQDFRLFTAHPAPDQYADRRMPLGPG